MPDFHLEQDIWIDRPVGDVFAAWSSADELANWFAPMAVNRPAVELDFRVSGAYSIRMTMPDGQVHTTQGEFREIVTNEKIVMTWRCDAFPDPPSLVTVTFLASADGTTVRVLHEKFESEDTCVNHGHGWEACLGKLKLLLEQS